MTFLEQRRADIATTIAANPTEVTIERTVKEPKGGGRQVTHSTLGPYKIRIFPAQGKQIAVNLQSSTGGTKQITPTWAFLADANTDIQCTSQITDTFVAHGKRFRVTAAYERYWGADKTSTDGNLEVID